MEGKLQWFLCSDPSPQGQSSHLIKIHWGKLGLMNPHLLSHINLQVPRDTDTINSSNSSIPVHGAVCLKPRVPTPLDVKLSPGFPPCDTSLVLPSNLLQLRFA